MFKFTSQKTRVILVGSLFLLIMILVCVFLYKQHSNKQNRLIESMRKIVDNNGNVAYYKDGNIENPIIESFLPQDLEISNAATHIKIKYINGIYCVDYQLPIQDIVLFGTLEHLNYLGFTDINLSEKHLKSLAENVPHLQTIIIERGSFSNNGGKYLGELKKLNFLYLFDLSISDKEIQEMKGIPLKEIKFINVPITDMGLKNMLPLKKIERVYLRDLPITDDITMFFNGCPHLKKINLYKSNDKENITLSGLKCTFLRDMVYTSSIDEIILDGVFVDDEILSSIERFENLKYLSIRTYCVTDNSKTLLEKFSQRMYISISTLGKKGELLFEYRGGTEP